MPKIGETKPAVKTGERRKVEKPKSAKRAKSVSYFAQVRLFTKYPSLAILAIQRQDGVTRSCFVAGKGIRPAVLELAEYLRELGLEVTYEESDEEYEGGL